MDRKIADAYACVYLYALGRFNRDDARSRLQTLGMPETMLDGALDCPSIRAITVSLLFKLGELSEATATRQLMRLGLSHQNIMICLWTSSIKQLFSIAGEAVRVRAGLLSIDPSDVPRRPATMPTVPGSAALVTIPPGLAA